MPITINGSGTVTGISAGGLPDGVITRPEMGYAGAILQVVNATYSTTVITGSSTFTDTGLSASITPSSASSKILITVNQAGCGKISGNTMLFLRLLRGSTSLIDFERIAGNNNATTYNFIGSCSCSYLDSPATTSIITYKTQVASQANVSAVYVNSDVAGVASTSTITLMEVAA